MNKVKIKTAQRKHDHLLSFPEKQNSVLSFPRNMTYSMPFTEVKRIMSFKEELIKV